MGSAAAIARALDREPHPDDWAPHPGPQTAFLELSCFEALYGGAAGGGKSDALLVDATAEIGKGWGSGYSAILFRRTFPDLERSLIRRSLELYPRLGGVFNASKFIWRFPAGESVSFAHMAHENDALAHKSAQYQYVGFDELTSFTEFQYTYLFSRVRSARGVPCRVRGATNPGDIGHQWVKRRFGPWVSRRAPRPARPGEVRYFVREGDSEREVPRGTPSALGRAFVPAKLSDNPALEQADPGYRARIRALPALERQRLEDGDWDAEPAKKDYWDRARVRVLRERPAREEIVGLARGWDFASSPTGDFTVGVLGAWTRAGIFVVMHVVRFQGAPDRVHAEFARFGEADRAYDPRTLQVIPLDPGAAGKFAADDFQRRNPRLAIRPLRPAGDKPTRFRPVSSRALAGNVAIVDDGSWDVEAYHGELEAFPLGSHDDQADATSDSYAGATGNVPATLAAATSAHRASLPKPRL